MSKNGVRKILHDIVIVGSIQSDGMACNCYILGENEIISCIVNEMMVFYASFVHIV